MDAGPDFLRVLRVSVSSVFKEVLTVTPLIEALSRVLPERQVITDNLRRLAYGTDASFYRMTPEVVAVIESEEEVQALLQAARAHGRPVTFGRK